MMHITIREMIAFAASGLLLAGAFGCVPGTTSGASLIDGLAALAPTSAVTDPNAPPTVDDLLG